MFGIWFGLVIVPSSILLLAVWSYWYLGKKDSPNVDDSRKVGVPK
ncbi:MAG: hypothetical protein DDT35_00600 [Firmicutes bacterium]|nr:hypothetical protein [Bacillota bacterium]